MESQPQPSPKEESYHHVLQSEKENQIENTA